MVEAFFTASRSGDVEALRTLLAEDVIAYTDGGGITRAALNPLAGFRRVSGFFVGLARKSGHVPSRLLHQGRINGLPGFVTIEPGAVLQTTALELENGRISAIYVVRNPDKLGHLPDLGPGDARATRTTPMR